MSMADREIVSELSSALKRSATLSAATVIFSVLPLSVRRTTSKDEATPGSSLSPSFFGSAFFGMVELRKRKEKRTSKRLSFGSARPSA